MKRLVVFVAAWVLLSLTVSVWAAPVNDNFTNATTIASQSTVNVTGSNVGATFESNEPIHNYDFPAFTGGRSVWWKWTAPASGYYTFSTAGSTSSLYSGSALDTVMAIYTGTALANVTLQGWNDNAPNTTDGTSRVDLNVTSGTTYYIAVDGFGISPTDDSLPTDYGTIKLAIHPDASPNDNFSARFALSGKNVYATGSNVDATKEASEPNHANNEGGKSVWWSWIAPTNGSVTISTRGSDFDTILGVYTGTSVDALTLIASNDDDPLVTSDNVHVSTVTFNAVAGTEYEIAVDGYYDGTVYSTGNVVLTVGMSNASATFSGPTVLGDGSFQFSLTGGVGSKYGVQVSNDLTNWTRVDTIILGTNGVTQYIDAGAIGGTNIFYRMCSP